MVFAPTRLVNETILPHAVIYCRVSDHKQIQGYSLATQQEICLSYAQRNGYAVIRSFIEEGESAKTAERTQLQKLLQFCKDRKNNVKAVIYYKLDRFARYKNDYFALQDVLKGRDIRMLSATEHLTDDPAGRFMEGMLASQAQFDNEVRTERSINGMKAAIQEGRYVWQPPFGYSRTLTGGRGVLVQNAQAAIIREAFERVAAGVTPIDEVRKIMYTRGFMNPRGKPFAKGYFYRLLKNKLYMGVIEKMGITATALCEPIVTPELFEEVQAVLENRKKQVRRYKRDHHDFPLRRYVKHPEGYLLRGAWCKGAGGQKYAYYRFEQVRGRNYQKKELERIFTRFFARYRLADTHSREMIQAIRSQYEIQTKEARKLREQAEKRLAELNERTHTLIEKNLQGVIPDDILKNQFALMEQEKAEIRALHLDDTDKIADTDKMFRAMREFLQKPHKLWAVADYEIKIQLQMFAFPCGVIFDGAKMRTLETCEILRVSDQFKGSNETGVRLRFRSVNKCVREANYLLQILTEKLESEK